MFFDLVSAYNCRLTKEEKSEDARCNYERYRVLIQNAFHGLSEADALAKISVEEMYPEPTKKITKKSKSEFFFFL